MTQIAKVNGIAKASLASVCGVAPDYIYKVNGVLWLDYANWTERTNAGNRNWQGVASSSDGTKLAACVNGGYIYTSTDSGANWTERTGAGSRNWYSIACSSDGAIIYACDSEGTTGKYIYRSTDSGANWTALTTAGGRYWQRVTCSADGQNVAGVASYDGQIHTSMDGGTNWNTRTGVSGVYAAIYWTPDGSVLFVVENGGDIYESIDGGATWGPRASLGGTNWWDITASEDGSRVLASRHTNKLYLSLDGANTFAELTLDGANITGYPVISLKGTRIMALGRYVFTSTNSGQTWVTRKSDASRSWNVCACSSQADKLIACVYGGSIWTSP